MTWRGVRPEDRTLALLWAASTLSTIVLRPFLEWAPVVLPRCPWHALTGLPCPTCGTTRAALALLRGEPLVALSFNPLAAGAAVLFLVGGLIAPVWVLTGRPVPTAFWATPRRLRWGALVALVANWIYLVWAGV